MISKISVVLCTRRMTKSLQWGAFAAAASAVPFAVLNGIDHLYWDAPLVLHALADYSSSEYCNALLLLTITKDFPGTRKECEKSMME